MDLIVGRQIDAKAFATRKEELVRVHENENKKVGEHVQYLREHTLTPSEWHVDEVLEALRLLTINDLQVKIT